MEKFREQSFIPRISELLLPQFGNWMIADPILHIFARSENEKNWFNHVTKLWGDTDFGKEKLSFSWVPLYFLQHGTYSAPDSFLTNEMRKKIENKENRNF